MEFQIDFEQGAKDEIAQLPVFVQRKIIGAIEKQLVHQPATPSKNRKRVKTKAAEESDPPLWELRVGEYRVFYDVNPESNEVNVQAIRHKPLETRTKDILA